MDPYTIWQLQSFTIRHILRRHYLRYDVVIVTYQSVVIRVIPLLRFRSVDSRDEFRHYGCRMDWSAHAGDVANCIITRKQNSATILN